jgi:hypothetical protein
MGPFSEKSDSERCLPFEASDTHWAYLYSSPRLNRGSGLTHFSFRFASVSSSTSRSIVFFSASMTISSPSWTRAIGPPWYDSGTT